MELGAFNGRRVAHIMQPRGCDQPVSVPTSDTGIGSRSSRWTPSSPANSRRLVTTSWPPPARQQRAYLGLRLGIVDDHQNPSLAQHLPVAAGPLSGIIRDLLSADAQRPKHPSEDLVTADRTLAHPERIDKANAVREPTTQTVRGAYHQGRLAQPRAAGDHRDAGPLRRPVHRRPSVLA